MALLSYIRLTFGLCEIYCEELTRTSEERRQRPFRRRPRLFHRYSCLNRDVNDVVCVIREQIASTSTGPAVKELTDNESFHKRYQFQCSRESARERVKMVASGLCGNSRLRQATCSRRPLIDATGRRVIWHSFGFGH